MSDGEAGTQSSVRSPASPPGAKLARAHTYPVAQRSSESVIQIKEREKERERTGAAAGSIGRGVLR